MTNDHRWSVGGACLKCGRSIDEVFSGEGCGPAPSTHLEAETRRRFHIEWLAAARPPVHPNPMTGRMSFETFPEAVAHMRIQAEDAKFVSLEERVTVSIDRSADLVAALGTPEGQDNR